jgi:hypothetical protein
MGWSVALACSSVGDPGRAFRSGLVQDPDAAAALARRLYPGSTVAETGDTVLDFALWPYEDELFVGAYGHALVVCDRRLFGVDDQARTLADEIAGALPGGSCGVLVLHNVVSGCWFRWSDVPLPFDYEEYGLALAREYLFGRDIAERGPDGFLALELPLRRFKLG